MIMAYPDKELIKKYQNNMAEGLRFPFKIERNRFFLEIKYIRKYEAFYFFDTDLGTKFFSFVFGLIHLPALRGNPERNYKKTSVGPRFPGTFEIYAASIIHNWQATKDRRLASLSDALNILGVMSSNLFEEGLVVQECKSRAGQKI